MRIKIEAGGVTAEALLNESGAAKLIWDALPFVSKANRWGEEVYFTIPVSAELENAAELVDVGDLGYWPRGSAFCIFFGPTPISRDNEIRPASAVSIIGKIDGDATVFRVVENQEKIRLSRSE
ncbi:MAG: hypothetical protein C4520_09105 [Candidatus Abyssobacteria bacterium SURF_5]|uniref:Cyclophilin TM1367-like domain-containing protein n=1 Tax=Abyssobacteria bacterium (strain SURF_5) TaxID=2093360 RepID=A0A3A4NMJ0_ABYX5|nr:MAG: hypothetical protein C4520_09105 [Candidatus Abyssubacteria bacterium SURF_5]